MNVNYPPSAVMNQINDILYRIGYARELGTAANVQPSLFDLYQDTENEINGLKFLLESNNITTNYADQLAKSLDKFLGAFSRMADPKNRILRLTKFENFDKPSMATELERDRPKIEGALSQFRITLEFFSKIDFFNHDLVIVGANGSGKTTLANHFVSHIKGNGILVTAQRILSLPVLESIRSYAKTEYDLKSIQLSSAEARTGNFPQEFKILIEHLLADDSKTLRNNRSQRDVIPAPTKLQVLLMMWNGIFSHLQLTLTDDINIEANKDLIAFHISKMSDGEKATLYLIAQVLLCPENGFVIVDEPEMHLHPAIHRKLWDRLESERWDATFIYLTHDLEFDSSRISAKKLWLKSFQYPDSFQLEEIPDNEIPQALLMELLGGWQDILFCEGNMGSPDEQVYSVLFPNYIIKPVGGCLNVINFTKAFNKLPFATKKAVGIIDSDYHSHERMMTIETDKIYGIRLPEIENLLFDEIVLTAICDELNASEKVIHIKNAVLKKLTDEKGLQVVNYVSARVDQHFKDSNVNRSNDITGLTINYEKFIRQVTIEEWANQRQNLLSGIISNQDYNEAIRIFNHKGLEAIANSILHIKNYNFRAIKLLQSREELRRHLVKYFPKFS